MSVIVSCPLEVNYCTGDLLDDEDRYVGSFTKDANHPAPLVKNSQCISHYS